MQSSHLGAWSMSAVRNSEVSLIGRLLNCMFYVSFNPFQGPCPLQRGCPLLRGPGAQVVGGKRGNCPPLPFSRDKEQNLQLTCVELALQSFKLDFADLSWTLAEARPQKQLLPKKVAISSTRRELREYLQATLLTNRFKVQNYSHLLVGVASGRRNFAARLARRSLLMVLYPLFLKILATPLEGPLLEAPLYMYLCFVVRILHDMLLY